MDEGGRALGGLDIAVANAGIPGPGGTRTAEAWDTMIGVDLTGVWSTVNAALPHIEA